MGCAGSSDGKRRRHGDDGDDMSDGGQSHSMSSRSSKSMTTVRSTRGRVAASSTTTPYLVERPKSPTLPVIIAPSASGRSSEGSKSRSNRSNRSRTNSVDDFQFGDLSVNPDDQRHARSGRLSRTASGANLGSPAGSIPLKPNVAAADVLFTLDDLIVTHEDLQGMKEARMPRRSEAAVRSYTMHALMGVPRRVKSLAFTGKRYMLVCHAEGAALTQRNAETGEEVRKMPDFLLRAGIALDALTALAVDPSGRFFAACTTDGTCVIRDVDGELGERRAKTLIPDDAVVAGTSAAIFASEKMLITGDTRGFIRVWNVETERANTHRVHGSAVRKGTVHALDFSSAKQMCVSAGNDKRCVLFRVMEPDTVVVEFKEHTAPVKGCAFIDESSLVVSTSEKDLFIWSSDDGTVTRSFTFAADFVSSSPFPTPNQSPIMTATPPTTDVSQPTSGADVCATEAHPFSVPSPRPSSRSNRALVGTAPANGGSVSPLIGSPRVTELVSPPDALGGTLGASSRGGDPLAATAGTTGSVTLPLLGEANTAAGRMAALEKLLTGKNSLAASRKSLFGGNGPPKSRIVTTVSIIELAPGTAVVILGDTNSMLYVVSCATGECELAFRLRGPPTTCVARGNTVLLGDTCGNLYRLDMTPRDPDLHY